MQDYLDLEVALDIGPDSTYVVKAHAQPGDGRATFAAAELAPLQELLPAVADFTITKSQARTIGEGLFRLIFRDETRDLYQRARGLLGPRQGMRIKLVISPQHAELSALPWELMFDTQQDDYLALRDISLVRYIPQLAPRPSIEARLPLRVLVTAAQTGKRLDVQTELASVQSALATLGAQVQVVIEEHTTFARLQSLLSEDFHIWHFVGHAGYDPSEEEMSLQLEDSRGDPFMLSARKVRRLLDRSSVRLAVLNACDTGNVANDVLSLAPALIQADIPAVLAMQVKVEDDAANVFVETLYERLSQGAPIDASVNAGRIRLDGEGMGGIVGWAIPVIYTRSPDGLLFRLGNATSANAPQPPAGRGTSVSVNNNTLGNNSSVSIGNVGSTSAGVDERAEERERLLAERRELKRVEHAHALTAARYGINLPVHIQLEMQDIAKKLTAIDARLRELGT